MSAPQRRPPGPRPPATRGSASPARRRSPALRVEDPVAGPDPAALAQRLTAIRHELLEASAGWQPWAEGRDHYRDASARNLLQYLALRRHDLRALQDPLLTLGVSSLGRSEGHVQATVDAVIDALTALSGSPAPPRVDDAPITLSRSRGLLASRTQELLGPGAPGRTTRIMVTMPTEAAQDGGLVLEMLLAGMNCMRVNCAHDGPDEWQAMCENLRWAHAQTSRRARIHVDLPGPKLRTGPVASQPARDGKGEHLRLSVGDRLTLVREGARARKQGDAQRTPRMCCSLPEAFAATRPGHHVWFDDGKIGGVVEAVDADSIEVAITAAKAKGAKLRPGKGINLPDAVLEIDLLGAHSAEALAFAVARADIVGLSFVSHASEVKHVHTYLDGHGRPELGIVLKIETRRAFERLPGLLLAALAGGRPAGVMIARGDLAVECGYERLAEVQEEILWLSEAAHMPVIWATEVLDRLASTGRPSRAEITDAAMGVRAECVMLNKGPQIADAIRVLDDILRRMHQHQAKKRSLLRRLRASDYTHTPPPAASARRPRARVG